MKGEEGGVVDLFRNGHVVFIDSLQEGSLTDQQIVRADDADQLVATGIYITVKVLCLRCKWTSRAHVVLNPESVHNTHQAFEEAHNRNSHGQCSADLQFSELKK